MSADSSNEPILMFLALRNDAHVVGGIKAGVNHRRCRMVRNKNEIVISHRAEKGLGPHANIVLDQQPIELGNLPERPFAHPLSRLARSAPDRVNQETNTVRLDNPHLNTGVHNGEAELIDAFPLFARQFVDRHVRFDRLLRNRVVLDLINLFGNKDWPSDHPSLPGNASSSSGNTVRNAMKYGAMVRMMVVMERPND
jgi:hypothetical protein